jgi:hypothetical protein
MGRKRQNELEVLKAALDPTEDELRQIHRLQVEVSVLRKVFSSYGPKNPAYLYIDANSLCYKALDPIYSSGDFRSKELVEKIKKRGIEKTHRKCYALVWTFLREIIDKIEPKNVYIAFDGPVNLAKMSQQKGRRYETGMNLHEESTFDTAAITPGTTWMEGLSKYLKSELEVYMKMDYAGHRPERVTFSSHLVSGEGEHKIMDHIRKTSFSMDDEIVVYGQDSDIVLLCMAIIETKRANKITICTEVDSPKLTRLYEKRKIQNTRYINLPFVSVNTLYSALRYLGFDRPNAVSDFIFCMTAIGNDFVPRPLAMSDVPVVAEALLEALAEVFQDDPSGFIYDHERGIDWENFAKFLEVFVGNDRELDYILSYRRRDGESPNRVIEAARVDGIWNEELSPERFRNAWYSNALRTSEISMVDVAEMCTEFLRGFVWTSAYYFQGQDNVTWGWHYPFAYPPLLEDVLECCSFLLESGVLGSVLQVPLYAGTKTNAAEQLVAVMHPRSLQWIPENLRVCWSNRSYLRDLMPQSIIIDKDGLVPNEVVTERYTTGIPSSEVEIIVVMKSSQIPEEFVKYLVSKTPKKSGFEFVFRFRDVYEVPDSLLELGEGDLRNVDSVSFDYERLVKASIGWTGAKVFPPIDMDRIRSELKRLSVEKIEEEEDVTYKVRTVKKPVEPRSMKGRGMPPIRGTTTRGGTAGQPSRGRGSSRGTGERYISNIVRTRH